MSIVWSWIFAMSALAILFALLAFYLDGDLIAVIIMVVCAFLALFPLVLLFMRWVMDRLVAWLGFENAVLWMLAYILTYTIFDAIKISSRSKEGRK